MKGQKEAVIEQVLKHLPTFQKYQDNALLLLTAAQLETIKNDIYQDILNKQVEYSKDVSLAGEVRSYARSMVMNHLKKAKELNGGTVTVRPNGAAPVRLKLKLAPKGVNLDLLPEDLQEFAKTLI